MFKIVPIEGSIEQIEGIYCDGINAGLKERDFDLGFIYSNEPFEIEALFTDNKFKAAPLKHYLQYESNFKSNFILVNSKNANALTGKVGIDDIKEIFNNLNFNFINPIMSSTGVIGVRLPKEKIIKGANSFILNNKNGLNFAKAIMTTDTYPKYQAYEVFIDKNCSFKIAAVAKGAGMIAPSLATMLCFIATDTNIPKNEMKEALQYGVEESFNAISVDGDKSTNDSVFLIATKKSNCYKKEAFFEALKLIMQDMALKIVSDGEGAKKSVAFKITGAKNNNEAKKVASSLANSLLVKTAIFGEDPNWGRIAATIGASGVECDEEKLKIFFEDILVYDRGKIYFDKETELKAAKVMQKKEFSIKCDLGIGEGSFTYFGCDLGYDYVKINADYRT